MIFIEGHYLEAKPCDDHENQEGMTAVFTAIAFTPMTSASMKKSLHFFYQTVGEDVGSLMVHSIGQVRLCVTCINNNILYKLGAYEKLG